jgi:V-type H+-transporting ATPase subunit B
LKKFEHDFIAQGLYETRDLYDSLSLAWKLLSLYPQESLTKIPKDIIKKFHRNAFDQDE